MRIFNRTSSRLFSGLFASFLALTLAAQMAQAVVLPIEADVQIAKSVDAASKHEGDTVTYTLTAHNNGTGDATDVLVTDLLPTGITFVTANPAADYNSATGVWTIGSLPNGVSAVLTITGSVAFGTVGTTIVNQANITTTAVDTNTNNNSSSAQIEVLSNVVLPPVVGGPCVSGPGHAETVATSTQGTLNNGDPITDGSRTNPANALGVSDSAFFSLGKQGSVTLGFNKFVVDVPGVDFALHEVTNGRDSYPEERADVAVSQDNAIWVPVGTASGLDFGTGVSTFDFSSTGLPWIKYIRVVDATNFAIHDATADGYDLEAIDVSYESCTKITLGKSGSYDSQTGTLSYTILWSVAGEGSTDVTITDKLPTGTTYVPASADHDGVYNNGTKVITWALGSQSAGTSGSVHFSATLDAALAMNQWAKTVVSFAQGKQANLVDPVAPERTDPAQALGVAQTVGGLYDNPLPDFIGKFFSLGFTDQPNGGELVIAFNQPVYNGDGPDIKVFEVTGGDNYPDEQVKVSVSDDNATWDDVGVVVRDGTVDLGSHSSANYIKLTDTSNRNLFDPTADGFDVDAVQALQLVPSICGVTNVAEASYTITLNNQPTTVSVSAQTTTTIDDIACEEDSYHISGKKWNDADGDAVQDENENGLAGWNIYIDTNDNGVKDQGEPSTVTDQSGNYSFANLTPGIYVIRELGQNGWSQTYPTVQSLGKQVVFITNFDITGKNFGNHQTSGGGEQGGGGGGPTGSISGIVFNDANNNGVLDNGEVSLSGWVVYLDQNDNSVLDNGEVSKTTASPYLFSGLADGAYTVREVTQPNWVQTLPTSNNALKYTVVIAGGNAVTDKDFGNFQTQGSGGGGSGGGGSGGGGGGGAINPSFVSGGSGGGVPQILGDSTTTPSATGAENTPPTQPQVLGEVTELPRTGAGAAYVFISVLFGLLCAGSAYSKLRRILQ